MTRAARIARRLARRSAWTALVRRAPTRLVLITAIALALLPAQHGRAWNAWTLDGTIVVWPKARCVRYLQPGSFPQGATHTNQLLEAMGDWSVIDGANFQFYHGFNSQDWPTDHFDGYSDTQAVPETDLDPGVLAVTYTVNSGAEWYDMDMDFNDFPLGVGWNFIMNPTCEEEALPGKLGFCFQLAALHECGHSLGLAHEPTGTEPVGDPWVVCTMNPSYAHGGSNGTQRWFETHADDRLGVRALYPDPNELLVSDLAALNFSWSDEYVGVPFTVHASPNPVADGAKVTIRSAIENRGFQEANNALQRFWLSRDETLSANDVLLAEVPWTVPGGGLYDFDLSVPVPEDFDSGEWVILSALDVLDAVSEPFEDNNDAAYCVPLTVLQRAPDIVDPLGQHFAVAGTPWSSPAPTLTHPVNMGPVVWSLAGFPPAGVTIHPTTGVISWQNPVANEFQYMFFVRATNPSGVDTQTLYLGVSADDCRGDANGDGSVNGMDVSLVLAYWGLPSASVDFNGNGVVDGADIGFVLAAWGVCP